MVGLIHFVYQCLYVVGVVFISTSHLWFFTYCFFSSVVYIRGGGVKNPSHLLFLFICLFFSDAIIVVVDLI